MSSLMDAIVINGNHCEVDLSRVIAIMKQDGTYNPGKSLDELREEITVAVRSSGMLLGGEPVNSFRFYGVKIDPKDRKVGGNPQVDIR